MKLPKKIIYLLLVLITTSCIPTGGSSPIADFGASQTNINIGDSINFNDLSSGIPTSWSWTFQGGTPATSTLKNPTNIRYNTAGTYNVTLVATNSAGNNTKTKTAYIVVSQNIQIPTISTTSISGITNTSASSGGNITSDGGSAVLSRGVCWNTSSNPTISNTKTTNGTGIGIFSSSLTGLIANTTFYVRAYATNSFGTAYGNQLIFTTTNTTLSDCGTVTDIDGNLYNTVTIGTQCWMKENLRTSKYNDGTSIPTNLDIANWQNTASGAYAIYDNNNTNNNIYGKLYNWYAVNSGKLAPVGWHVPTDAEWTTLMNYLGENVAAGKMKSTSSLWLPPNTLATNSTNFSGLPSGSRTGNGTYDYIGKINFLWSSTENFSSKAWARILYYDSGGAGRFSYYKNEGLSVRCIKD